MRTTLEVAIAGLPAGIGAKKVSLVLRDKHPALEFTTRDIRDALNALTLVETVPTGVERRLAAMMAEGSTPGVTTRLDALTKDFVIRRAGTSGLGAYATRSIKRSERLLSEAPLVEWTIREGEAVTTAGISRLVAALGEAEREDYFALCQNDIHGATKTAYGVWLSNAYPTDSPMRAGQDALRGVIRGEKTGAVFAGACRFNHACKPNSHSAWNARLGRQTIHALCDIPAGSEITVSYLPDVGTDTAGRQARLQADFGFLCTCATCTLTGAALARSDANRTRIGELSGLLAVAVNGDMTPDGQQDFRRKRTNAIALAEERLTLMEAEGTEAFSWDTLYAACQYCRSVGDKQEATLWAGRAAENARLALGRDSDEFQKYAGSIGSRGQKVT